MYKKTPSKLCEFIDKHCLTEGYSINLDILQDYFEEDERTKDAFEILGLDERKDGGKEFFKILDWVSSGCEYVESAKCNIDPNNRLKIDFANKCRVIPWSGIDLFSLAYDINDQASLDTVYECYEGNEDLFSNYEKELINPEVNRIYGVRYYTHELHYFSQNYMFELQQRIRPAQGQEEIDFYYNNDPTLDLIRMIEKAESLEDIAKLKNNNIEKRKAYFIVCRFMRAAFGEVINRAERLTTANYKKLFELDCFEKNNSIPVEVFSSNSNSKEKNLKDFFKY